MSTSKRFVGEVVELSRDCELGQEAERAVVTALVTPYMTLTFLDRAPDCRDVHTGADYKHLRPSFAPGVVARVVNHRGRPFNVRLVRVGERYGLNNRLVHDKDEPLVEFWDASCDHHPSFTLGFGQFVSRYSLGTLANYPIAGGLDLCGSVPEWRITAGNLLDALAAVKTALHRDKAP